MPEVLSIPDPTRRPCGRAAGGEVQTNGPASGPSTRSRSLPSMDTILPSWWRERRVSEASWLRCRLRPASKRCGRSGSSHEGTDSVPRDDEDFARPRARIAWAVMNTAHKTEPLHRHAQDRWDWAVVGLRGHTVGHTSGGLSIRVRRDRWTVAGLANSPRTRPQEGVS